MKQSLTHNRFLTCCLLFVICIGTACKRDKCKHVTCLNGTCVDGTCNCSTGYFGEDCGQVINAGYDGTWPLSENCTAGADQYDLHISTVAGSLTQLHIAGLWGKPDTIVAEFGADGYSLNVARQQISNVEITATGTINAAQDEINLDYQVYYIGFTQAFDQCTAKATKN